VETRVWRNTWGRKGVVRHDLESWGEASIIITRRKALTPLPPPGAIDQKPLVCSLVMAFTPLNIELAVAFYCAFRCQKKKQMSEKKIFWILLACGPCGID
jgi:hypothetical protein